MSPDDEDDVWRAAMQDVKPLKRPAAKQARTGVPKPKKLAVTVRETIHVQPKTAKDARKGAGLDRNTDDKLRRGKMVIEGRIDLHGFRQKEAEQVVTGGLVKYYNQGKRCVLVITGQGTEKSKENDAIWWETKPGLLRRMLPQWLKQQPLSDIVLQIHPAKQKDGGAGAFYVLLRRKRDVAR